MTAFERTARPFIASRASKGTRDLYYADLARWLKHCEATQTDPDAPTLESAVAFRDSLHGPDGKPFAGLTVRRTLSALSAMYEAATLVTTRNLFKSSKVLPRPPASEYSRTEAVPEEVVIGVIQKTKQDNSPMGLRDAAVLSLLHETGLRRVSVSLLRRDDLFERDGQTLARVVVKGNKRKEVEIPETAAKALENWLANAPESEFVFPICSRLGVDRPMWPTTINKIIHDRAKAAGYENIRLHPHQFRAAFITSALDAGVPLHEIQAAAHHNDPATTTRYDRGVRGVGVTGKVAEFRKAKRE